MGKQRILLVDDEPDILEFIEYNLVKEGYDVHTAGNGREGVALAKKPSDLILLDVMMPEMDGVEACTGGGTSPRDRRLWPLTARGEDCQIAGFEAGADDYILKPVKPRVCCPECKPCCAERNPRATWGAITTEQDDD